jgi:hypothetical protein
MSLTFVATRCDQHGRRSPDLSERRPEFSIERVSLVWECFWRLTPRLSPITRKLRTYSIGGFWNS